MEDPQQIIKLASSLKVLYVEDESHTREAFSKHLSRFFHDLDVAVDGQEGLAKALANKYDIVITDIQMPNLTGIEMLKKIKEHGIEVKTIITTAFNDQDYFLDSIALGVDKYIIKPVRVEDLYSVIYDIAKAIDNAKKAVELQQLKINQAARNTMEDIANSYPSPTCVIATNNKVIFINNAFKEILSNEQIERAMHGDNKISDFFVTKIGFEHSFNAIKNNPHHNKVIIQVPLGKKKIFHITSSSVSLSGYEGASTIYSFTDITALEFQKLRVKLYSEMLQELVMLKHKNAASTTKASTPTVLISKEEHQAIRQKIEPDIVSSGEYIAEIGDDALEQLYELRELEEEVTDLIDRFGAEQSFDSLQKLAVRFEMYAQAIDILIEFKDLALAIKNLSYYIESLTAEDIQKISKKLAVYLDGIASDLKEWRSHIFELQDAQNIHYLDSSLLSSCFQIQLECNMLSKNGASLDDEGELELF